MRKRNNGLMNMNVKGVIKITLFPPSPLFIRKHLKLYLSSKLKTIGQKLRVKWRGLSIRVCVLCANSCRSTGKK